MFKTRKNYNLSANRTQHVSFGVEDSKGRAVGADVYTGEACFSLAPDDAIFYFTHAPGCFYYFRAQATRGGSSFGAVQRELFFDTPEERDAAVAAYLKDARKRAIRNHTTGA